MAQLIPSLDDNFRPDPGGISKCKGYGALLHRVSMVAEFLRSRM